MKIFKKLAFGFLAFLLLMSVGGYIYFDQKFTPEKNYLMIKNASGIIPVSWLGNDKNAMLLPIRFPGNKETFYLQFDTGSPYTLFYSGAIKNIKEINIKNGRAKAVFYVGNSEISSDKFRIFKNEISNRSDSVKIIGTIGADVLEDRKTVINLRENYVAFNLKMFRTILKITSPISNSKSEKSSFREY